MLREETSHIDEQGTVHMTLKEHPAFAMKEKLHRMRKDLWREMIATRREKAKINDGSGEVSDLVKQTTRLASKVRGVLEEEESRRTIDAEEEDEF